MSARDTSGSAPQHSHPHNNTMSRNEKFWVDQVTVPHPPPPGNDKGWGKKGGGVYSTDAIAVCSNFISIGCSFAQQYFKACGALQKQENIPHNTSQPLSARISPCPLVRYPLEMMHTTKGTACPAVGCPGLRAQIIPPALRRPQATA